MERHRCDAGECRGGGGGTGYRVRMDENAGVADEAAQGRDAASEGRDPVDRPAPAAPGNAAPAAARNAAPEVADETAGGSVLRATVWVRGRVQGVGFRWWTRARALELGLAGWARNTADGRVEVVAEGPREAVAELLQLLAEEPSSAGRPGRVTAMSAPQLAAPKGEAGFRER